MEKGGVFLFDMNTPYKHRNVLGENVFTFEEEDASCVWRNHYSAADRRVEISVDIDYRETGEHFHEQFCEYTYDLDTIRTALAGMKAKRQLEAQPGEDYGFDAPRLVVNVSAAGESTTLTVGAENPVTGDVYVRREGGDAVYTVDAAKFRCMEQTKAELFGAFSPAGITVSDIEAVRYTLQSGETIKLQSVSQPTEADSTTYQTVWQLTDEPDAALDTGKTDALLAALASYVTGQDTAADLSACGFDAPLVTAEVTTADGTVTLIYAIGTDGYYMMVSGDSSVYTVDGQTVQALCLTARQLKADT